MEKINGIIDTETVYKYVYTQKNDEKPTVYKEPQYKTQSQRPYPATEWKENGSATLSNEYKKYEEAFQNAEDAFNKLRESLGSLKSDSKVTFSVAPTEGNPASNALFDEDTRTKIGLNTSSEKVLLNNVDFASLLKGKSKEELEKLGMTVTTQSDGTITNFEWSGFKFKHENGSWLISLKDDSKNRQVNLALTGMNSVSDIDDLAKALKKTNTTFTYLGNYDSISGSTFNTNTLIVSYNTSTDGVLSDDNKIFINSLSNNANNLLLKANDNNKTRSIIAGFSAHGQQALEIAAAEGANYDKVVLINIGPAKSLNNYPRVKDGTIDLEIVLTSNNITGNNHDILKQYYNEGVLSDLIDAYKGKPNSIIINQVIEGEKTIPLYLDEFKTKNPDVKLDDIIHYIVSPQYNSHSLGEALVGSSDYLFTA